MPEYLTPAILCKNKNFKSYSHIVFIHTPQSIIAGGLYIFSDQLLCHSKQKTYASLFAFKQTVAVKVCST